MYIKRMQKENCFISDNKQNRNNEVKESDLDLLTIFRMSFYYCGLDLSS